MLKSNAHEIAKLQLHEAALGYVAASDGRAWPGFEPTRRAKARGADGERAGRRTRLQTTGGQPRLAARAAHKAETPPCRSRTGFHSP